MLSTYELFLNLFVAIVLFPIIVGHLLAGSPPSGGGPMRKYQLAEPRLDLVSNLFVLSLCFLVMNRLGRHFGLYDATVAGRVDGLLQMPFMLLFFVFTAFLVRAVLKVHRSTPSGGGS